MQIGNIILNAELMDILLELRNQLSIQHIDYLKDIKDSSDNIQITCPYHKNGQERKPSGGLRKDTGIFHCFTCGETHTLPEVISYCFGRDDLGLYGKQWLLKNFATLEIEERKDIVLNYSRSKVTINNDVKYVSEEELDKYRYYHPYWKKRGITDDYIIELFDLGYDITTSCITFPCKDINGNCLFVARRSVNTKWFNYPKDTEKPIYGAYELTRLKQYPKEVIITESMLDCLTAWQYGKYAVALNGLGSSSQYEMLNKMPCRKFILATDMDEAGKKARRVLKKELKGKIITEYVWDIKKAKDLNDMTKEMFDNLKEVF